MFGLDHRLFWVYVWEGLHGDLIMMSDILTRASGDIFPTPSVFVCGRWWWGRRWWAWPRSPAAGFHPRRWWRYGPAMSDDTTDYGFSDFVSLSFGGNIVWYAGSVTYDRTAELSHVPSSGVVVWLCCCCHHQNTKLNHHFLRRFLSRLGSKKLCVIVCVCVLLNLWCRLVTDLDTEEEERSAVAKIASQIFVPKKINLAVIFKIISTANCKNIYVFQHAQHHPKLSVSSWVSPRVCPHPPASADTDWATAPAKNYWSAPDKETHLWWSNSWIRLVDFVS